MSTATEKFLAWERASRDTIDVKRCYIDMAGDLVAGVMLSQIIYWFLPDKNGQARTTIERDGRQWIAKSRKDWEKECRVKEKQSDRVISSLESNGLVTVKVFKFNGMPVKHISLNTEVVADKLSKLPLFLSEEKRNSSQRNNGIPERGITEFPTEEEPYKEAETTAETTAEIKSVGAPASPSLFGEEPAKGEKKKTFGLSDTEYLALKDVWAHYIHKFGKNPNTYTATETRKKKGASRLLECRKKCSGDLPAAVVLMKRAIDALAADEWHIKNRVFDWEYLFKSETKFEQILNRWQGRTEPDLETAEGTARDEDGLSESEREMLAARAAAEATMRPSMSDEERRRKGLELLKANGIELTKE